MLIVWFFAYKKLAQFAVQGALPPRRSESPVCATDNKQTLLCVASAGLVYWVTRFFLLGRKARILGLTRLTPIIMGNLDMLLCPRGTRQA